MYGLTVCGPSTKATVAYTGRQGRHSSETALCSCSTPPARQRISGSHM